MNPAAILAYGLMGDKLKKEKKKQRKGITRRKGGKGKDKGRLIENQTETDSERKEIETCRKNKQINKQFT